MRGILRGEKEMDMSDWAGVEDVGFGIFKARQACFSLLGA